MFHRNEHRQQFKKRLLVLLADRSVGSEISDSSLRGWMDAEGIKLTLREAQQVIWAMEREIGADFMIRLKRLRGSGYLILEPREQANLAVTQGGKKMKRVLRKTTQRLEAVNVGALEPAERDDVLARTRSFRALEHIVRDSVGRPKLVARQIEILDNTASSLRVLEAIRRPERPMSEFANG